MNGWQSAAQNTNSRADLNGAQDSSIQMHHGGKQGSDARLRRVGSGAAWIEFIPGQAMPKELAWMRGPLMGSRQSVPRGELFAIVEALRHSTSAPIVIFSDASYVVKGWHEGPAGKHTTHSDLWTQVWQEIERLEWQVLIVKVKAHTEAIDLWPGRQPHAALIWQCCGRCPGWGSCQISHSLRGTASKGQKA